MENLLQGNSNLRVGQFDVQARDEDGVLHDQPWDRDGAEAAHLPPRHPPSHPHPHPPDAVHHRLLQQRQQDVRPADHQNPGQMMVYWLLSN